MGFAALHDEHGTVLMVDELADLRGIQIVVLPLPIDGVDDVNLPAGDLNDVLFGSEDLIGVACRHGSGPEE